MKKKAQIKIYTDVKKEKSIPIKVIRENIRNINKIQEKDPEFKSEDIEAEFNCKEEMNLVFPKPSPIKLISELNKEKYKNLPKNTFYFIGEFKNNNINFQIEIGRMALMETIEKKNYQDFREGIICEGLKICSIQYYQEEYEPEIKSENPRYIEVNFKEKNLSILKFQIEYSQLSTFHKEIIKFSESPKSFTHQATIRANSLDNSKEEVFLIFSWYFFSHSLFSPCLYHFLKYFENDKLKFIISHLKDLTNSIMKKISNLNLDKKFDAFINGIWLIGELYEKNHSLIGHDDLIFEIIRKGLEEIPRGYFNKFNDFPNKDKLNFYQKLAFILVSFYLQVKGSIFKEIKILKNLNFDIASIEKEICKILKSDYLTEGLSISQKTLICDFIEYYATESIQLIQTEYKSDKDFFDLINQGLSQEGLTFNSDALYNLIKYFKEIIEQEINLFESFKKVKRIVDEIQKILDPQLSHAMFKLLQQQYMAKFNDNCIAAKFDDNLDILEAIRFTENELESLIFNLTEKYFGNYLNEIYFYDQICKSRKTQFQQFLFFAYASIFNKNKKIENKNIFDFKRIMDLLKTFEEYDTSGLIDKSDIISLILNELSPDLILMLKAIIEANTYVKNENEKTLLNLKLKEICKELIKSHNLFMIFQAYNFIIGQIRANKEYENCITDIDNFYKSTFDSFEFFRDFFESEYNSPTWSFVKEILEVQIKIKDRANNIPLFNYLDKFLQKLKTEISNNTISCKKMNIIIEFNCIKIINLDQFKLSRNNLDLKHLSKSENSEFLSSIFHNSIVDSSLKSLNNFFELLKTLTYDIEKYQLEKCVEYSIEINGKFKTLNSSNLDQNEFLKWFLSDNPKSILKNYLKNLLLYKKKLEF